MTPTTPETERKPVEESTCRRCTDYDDGCEEDLIEEGFEFIIGCFLGTVAPYPADGYCPILHGEN